MKFTKPEHRISLALALALSFVGSFASTQGIEATAKGTPIDLSAQTLSETAELIQLEEKALVRVKGTAGKEATLHLFDLESPVIDSDGYAITGEVRYEGVVGEGYLEMWNHMPAEKGGSDIAQSFFSRTLDVSGPLGKLTGDSEWRSFQLPAYVNDGSGRRPLKLTVNVVLPGEGSVEIRDLRLQNIPTPIGMGANIPGLGRFIVIGSFAFFLGAGVLALLWVLKKRRADSELRRIQALDS